ncbi:exodeoxyribonuclease V alpha subunit [Sarcina sp. DSM 11001]|uniref:SF1B family DNA helicase RecD2 n=1 Tax=Sarcina sp. DSM 11001 TaxID=1798184 RepID=UPI0008927717|nr:AAA family ATPase [Sarcina sp. DSM 11001]SDK84482.1 exodeoxyribonuclease V alpha subunit [Sarcina sp. DSM 11001]
MTAYKGFVSHIVYRNEENSYTVFELTLTGSDNGNRAGSDSGTRTGTGQAGSAEQPDTSELGDVMTCVGYPVSISEGESCVVEGEYTTHPVYGEQLRVRSYRMIAPENAQAMYRYLAAGSIKRIGPAMAARIIKMFGDDTLRVMEEEPEKLARVKGISLNIAREIGAQMEDKKDLRDAMIFLQKYGIGSAHASRIWQTYGMCLYEIMKTNPYRLAEDIRGIGFATADEIARRIGIRADSEYRIRSGLLYNLFMASGEGHSFLPRDILLKRTGELLRLPPDEVLLQMENLAIEGRLKIRWRGEDRSEAEVYLTGVYRREQEIARMLLDLDARLRGSSKDKAALRKMEDRISALEKEEKITLDPLQRKAVLEAASNAVLLISGGPGTGKTTTINTIIRFFKGEKLEVVLAAPTGRAARRMSEATGYPAMTIHRLLGVRSPEDSDPGEGGFPDAGREYSAGGSAGEKQGGFSYFERGKDNPIKADVVIIDEMSMVDMNLFHALLMAVPAGARLVMVGDVNQLPSVGPGCVLQDLIESGSFHTIMLRHIFRQASESDIVMNAHRILEGTSLPMDNKSRDFFFLERDQVPVIYKHTVQLIRQMLPGYVGCRPEDIQVLTPMRRGNLGVARLNEVLQSVLNPPAAGKREHEDHDTVFREGDKVMQTRNNYSIEWEIRGNFGMPVEQGTGIFNGDFGRIMEIDPGRKVMTVCFDDARMVEYQFSDLEDLDLAYAITVHKSQGSEYPAVILPLLSGPSGLFNRNLLYTAVTRARKCVVMLGSRGAVDRMIANTQRTHRYTGLRERILEMGDGKDGGFS